MRNIVAVILLCICMLSMSCVRKDDIRITGAGYQSKYTVTTYFADNISTYECIRVHVGTTAYLITTVNNELYYVPINNTIVKVR